MLLNRNTFIGLFQTSKTITKLISLLRQLF